MTNARPPKVPGFALLGVGGTLFVLILVVALVARATPPPTVSELSPQATRQIKETTGDLSGSTGADGGQGAAVQPGTAQSSPDPEVIETQRVKRCIADPPRQIEDPQSPPCVPYWPGGDNGGATWKGVTDKEIRIAIGNYLRWDDASRASGEDVAYDQLVERYETFFNRRFEFYGRKLDLVTYTPSRPAVPAVNMKADAVKVDEEMGAFAAAQYSEQDGRHWVYFDALAERKIIGVVTGSGGMSHTDEAHLARHAPYQWDYTPTIDRMLLRYGDFLCKVLVGKPAEYAAPPQAQEPVRKFGIIVDTGFKDTPPADVSALVRTLDACGSPPVLGEWNQEGAPTSVLLDFRDQHVTSVMYTGQVGLLALRIMSTASGQGFHPEWLVWDMGIQASDGGSIIYPKDQAPHIFGLQVYNKILRSEDMPYVWASREIAPEVAPPQGEHFERLYKSLLLLASGIQMAGPKLTPHAFEEALMRTEFPNPGAKGPPYYQARVGFPGIHSMQQDLAMIWLSGSERSPATGVAPSFCYVNRGQRYGLGEWPSDARFFNGPCR